MPKANVHQAEAGEEVLIARRGQPVARLVRCKAEGKRQPEAKPM